MAQETPPPFPGIYERPKAGRRRKRSPLAWTVGVVAALVLAAAAYLGTTRLLNGSPSVGPSRANLQAQIQAEVPKHVSGVTNVVCVMPSSWSPGQTFTCYGYGASSRQLAQVNGTVLPDSGDQAQWNESWSTDGPVPTSAARTPAPSSTPQTQAAVATGCSSIAELRRQVETGDASQVPMGPGTAFSNITALSDEGYPPADAGLAADARAVGSDFTLWQSTQSAGALMAELTAMSGDCSALGFTDGA